MILGPAVRLYCELKDFAALRRLRDRLIELVQPGVLTLIEPELKPLASVRIMLAKTGDEPADRSSAVGETVERFETLREATMAMLMTQAGQEPASRRDVINLQHALFDYATEAQANVTRVEEAQRMNAERVDQQLATLASEISGAANVASSATAMTARLSQDLDAHREAEWTARQGLQTRLIECLDGSEAQHRSLALLAQRVEQQAARGRHQTRTTRLALMGLAVWSLINTVCLVLPLPW